MVKGESNVPHTALYRKYRPRSLDGIVGQSQVAEILRRSLKQGKVAHAYLLTGPRGVGKTSIARILAHEINQLPYDGENTHLDIIEIDAASNNGVDDVRELRDKVQLAPISATKKVYIIDEVHMLSKPAFNALLKTLEEPPAHVVFVLATTDLHKVPATIISRTQHFTFHSISPADLASHLGEIAKSEKIKISPEALAEIATRGGGSFRDSISLLDQLSSFADEKEGITLELIQSVLGLAPHNAVDSLLEAVEAHDVAAVVTMLDGLENQGIQPTTLADQLIHALRARLAKQPQYAALIDALIGVGSSPQPQLKLLTTLVISAKPKTMAARATKPVPQVLEAPIIYVEKPAPKPAPKPAAEKPAEAPVEKPAEEPVADVVEAPAAPAKKPAKKTGTAVPLDWDALIEHVREHFLALYSVLSKCDYEFDGSTLTLYAVRKFNKTKLDEAKYLSQLNEALAAIDQTDLTIVTLPERKPPSDEKLAKVAAMMGGGEEVSLEEIGEKS